jgi:hypothetical protein
MKTLRWLVFPVLALFSAVSVPAHAYTPKVTKADIVAGGGSCAGNLCTINGRMWDCSGGGYCTLIKT